jgi:hypothetical protein
MFAAPSGEQCVQNSMAFAPNAKQTGIIEPNCSELATGILRSWSFPLKFFARRAALAHAGERCSSA